MWHVEGAAAGEVKRSAVAPRANLPTPSVSDSAVRGMKILHLSKLVQASRCHRWAGRRGCAATPATLHHMIHCYEAQPPLTQTSGSSVRVRKTSPLQLICGWRFLHFVSAGIRLHICLRLRQSFANYLLIMHIKKKRFRREWQSAIK